MTITLAGQSYQVDLANPLSLAIALDFNGPQPNHFGSPDASMRTLQSGSFIGDTQRGGSCNVSELTLVPHCNGTHTETVHHVCNQPVYISDVLKQGLFAATLLTVSPIDANKTNEDYCPVLAPNDQVITRTMLQARIRGSYQ